MTEPVAPPGWPKDLPPAFTDQFGEQVVGWLLDRGPAGLRGRSVWRRQPRALAMVVSGHCRANLRGLRETYAAARRELVDVLPADELDQVLVALEASGAEAAESDRQVGIVLEALAGVKWRRRL